MDKIGEKKRKKTSQEKRKQKCKKALKATKNETEQEMMKRNEMKEDDES